MKHSHRLTYLYLFIIIFLEYPLFCCGPLGAPPLNQINGEKQCSFKIWSSLICADYLLHRLLCGSCSLCECSSCRGGELVFWEGKNKMLLIISCLTSVVELQSEREHYCLSRVSTEDTLLHFLPFFNYFVFHSVAFHYYGKAPHDCLAKGFGR